MKTSLCIMSLLAVFGYSRKIRFPFFSRLFDSEVDFVNDLLGPLRLGFHHIENSSHDISKLQGLKKSLLSKIEPLTEEQIKNQSRDPSILARLGEDNIKNKLRDLSRLAILEKYITSTTSKSLASPKGTEHVNQSMRLTKDGVSYQFGFKTSATVGSFTMEIKINKAAVTMQVEHTGYKIKTITLKTTNLADDDCPEVWVGKALLLLLQSSFTLDADISIKFDNEGSWESSEGKLTLGLLEFLVRQTYVSHDGQENQSELDKLLKILKDFPKLKFTEPLPVHRLLPGKYISPQAATFNPIRLDQQAIEGVQPTP